MGACWRYWCCGVLSLCLTIWSGVSVAVDQDRVLRMVLGTAPDNLNVLGGILASASYIHMQLFLRFKDSDDDARWELLDHAEVSADGLVYTLHLRDNLPWSDGRLLEAVDAVAAMRYQFRTSDLVINSIYASVAVKQEGGRAEPVVRLIDRLTYEVTLSRPDPLFLSRLSLSPATALRQDKLDEFGDDGWYLPEHLLTLGPFRLAKLDLPHSMVLEKYPDFPGADQLYWDRIIISFVSKPEKRLRALQLGEFDMAPLDETSGALGWGEHGPGKLIPFSLPGSRFILLNPANSILANPALREALALLADPATLTPRESKLAKPLYALVPAHFDKDYVSRDVRPSTDRESRFQQARALLEKQGYSQDKPLKLRLRVLDMRSNLLPAERLKRIAIRYGVDLELVIEATDGHYKAFFEGDYDLIAFEWFPGIPVVEEQMTPFLQTSSSLLQHGYANPVYLATLGKIKFAKTKEELYRYIHLLEDTLMKDHYVLPFAQFFGAYVVGPRIDEHQKGRGRVWQLEPSKK